MEIILNELSLDGQFSTEQEFFDSLLPMLKIHKLVEEANETTLLRHHEIYARRITQSKTLYDILKDSGYKTISEIRAFKRMIYKLTHDEPFWSFNPLHNNTSRYILKLNEHMPTHGHCLAEACERDKIIISFIHNDYLDDTLEVLKNGELVLIINVIKSEILSDLLFENQLIKPLTYSHYWFNPLKLSFEYLEDEYGYDTLSKEEIKTFIASFKLFHELSWDEIVKSEGLQYKAYSPSAKEDNWFRHSEFSKKNIYKFRVSQKYRCFGFREGETFFVLRFETTHEYSDNG